MTITLTWWMLPVALCVLGVLQAFLWPRDGGGWGGIGDGCMPLILGALLWLLALGITLGKLVFA